MLTTLQTLFEGLSARTEDRLRDTFAIELIEQKIREAEQSLSAAKLTLASLIQRQRSETRLAQSLKSRIAKLSFRAEEALAANRDDLAKEAAQAIADMENELTRRNETIERLDTRAAQLRASVEKAHRRLIDLKQGAITARAILREHAMQSRLNKTLGSTSAADEAEALIARVCNQDDPFEQSEVLRDIDQSLSDKGIDNRLADAGFGEPNRITGDAVLERLKSKSKKE